MTDPTVAPASCVSPDVASEAERAHWFIREVHPHDHQLRAYLRGAFPSVRDVDDVVQESYLRIWKARAVHPIESAKAFLFLVARRLALRQAVKSRLAPLEFAGDLSEVRFVEASPDPAEAFSYREKVAVLADALAELPVCCREIVILRKLHGLPQKTVAAQLGLSERTVENQLARGIRRCERFFQARGIRTLH